MPSCLFLELDLNRFICETPSFRTLGQNATLIPVVRRIHVIYHLLPENLRSLLKSPCQPSSLRDKMFTAGRTGDIQRQRIQIHQSFGPGQGLTLFESPETQGCGDYNDC